MIRLHTRLAALAATLAATTVAMTLIAAGAIGPVSAAAASVY